MAQILMNLNFSNMSECFSCKCATLYTEILFTYGPKKKEILRKIVCFISIVQELMESSGFSALLAKFSLIWCKAAEKDTVYSFYSILFYYTVHTW